MIRIPVIVFACALLAPHYAHAAETPPPEACLGLMAGTEMDAERIRTCVFEREKQWGRDDPRFAALVELAADHLSRDKDSAAKALTFRRRAYALAQRRSAEPSPDRARAAMAYAKTWILSGQCTAYDARITPLIDDAAAGYTVLTEAASERSVRLREVAAAYADGLHYARAVETLQDATGATPSADDLERMAEWTLLSGDRPAAFELFDRALEVGDPALRVRIVRGLKPILFAAGEFERLARIKELYGL